MISALIRWSSRNLFLILIGTVLATGAGIYAVRNVPLDALPGNEPDQVDLDQRSGHQQPGGSDRGARRRELEILAPDLVERLEVVQISQEHLGLHHGIQRAPGRLQRLPQVAEHIVRLQLDVGTVIRKPRPPARLGRHAGLVVAGDLARGEHPRADPEALVVVGERARRAGLDDLDGH